jgi:hypothetical protein
VIRQREAETGGHVPVIAMTAHAIKGDRERFLHAGMDDFLAKPFNSRQLYEMVEKSVGNGNHPLAKVVLQDLSVAASLPANR